LAHQENQVVKAHKPTHLGYGGRRVLAELRACRWLASKAEREALLPAVCCLGTAEAAK
jgi:hypothetical protein